jgi:hypothetical protein
MTTGMTATCICGSRSFIVLDAQTGEPIDLKTVYETARKRAIDPTALKDHDPLDLSRLRTVCANPECRRPL